MRKNTVKSALKAGLPQVGTWLSLGDLNATRMLARTGLHYLTVDLEHSAIDWSQASMLFAAIADAGCVPLARVPEGRHDYIKRSLDAGAYGIIVPMVETVEQARMCIAAAKYPPHGNRSVGGSLHAINFEAAPSEYYRRANDEILVILQTESPLGVQNADEIYRLPGVDAIFVGPNDLFAQMRSDDGKDPAPEDFERMLQTIRSAGQRCNVPVGMHVMSVEEVRFRIAEGWRFLAIGSELSFLLTETQRVVSALNLKT